MRPATVLKSTVGVFVGIFILSIFGGSWYTVDQTERVVNLRNGAVTGISGPGLHFKIPMVDDIARISVKTTTVTWAGPSKLETYSRDQQPTDVALSVTYHIPENEVAKVYATYTNERGMVETVIHPRVLEQFKNVFGSYDAVRAIQDRAKLNADADAADAITKAINGPVIVDSVQVLDVKFSPEYEKSVEQRMMAQVEVQKLEQNLAREKVQAQIVTTQADAAAYRVRAEGNAAAAAIKAKSDALAANPALVQLTAAEKWDGKLPTTMVPGGATPFIGVK